ncbi:MAG: DUF4920 domain-containing protein [Bacteroidota bacterium]
MKKLLLAVLGLGLTLSLSAQSAKTSSFGETITTEKAISVKRLPGMVKEGDTLKVKVEGTVNSVCQKKGCWMKMDMGNGETMMVHFKDYGFFVPKDCSGKKLVMEGIAFIDVTPVAQLRHYAEDAGKSKDEIAAITEDEKELTFEASGVILYNE